MSPALEPLRNTGKVSHFGCAAGGGRLVRVALAPDADPGKPPRSAEVECPACEYTHNVALTWRAPTDLDVDRKPDLVLDGDGAVVTP